MFRPDSQEQVADSQEQAAAQRAFLTQPERADWRELWVESPPHRGRPRRSPVPLPAVGSAKKQRAARLRQPKRFWTESEEYFEPRAVNYWCHSNQSAPPSEWLAAVLQCRSEEWE